MIKIGRILLCTAIVMTAVLHLPAAVATLETSIEDSAIDVGDTTTLKVKLPGDAGDVKPLKYPSVPGLTIEYNGMQQSYQYVNGKSWSGVELMFTITAHKPGRYRIPSFIFRRDNKTMRSEQVTLSVMGGSRGREQATGTGDIRSEVDLSATTAYVGQPIIMRYYILSSGINATVRGFEQFPVTKGFVIKKIEDSSRGEGTVREGDYEKTHIASFALIPAGDGSYQVGGGAVVLAVEMHMRRLRDDFFGMNFPGFSQNRRLIFDSKNVIILPMPKEGSPKDFQGDIGSFTMKVDFDGKAIQVYQEKKVTVTVEGVGNLVTMNKPLLEKEVEGLKVIAEDGESSIKIEGGKIRGSRTFTYTLIPEKAGTITPGKFTFTFFNPDSGKYETAESKEISFVAKGDGSKPGVRYDADTDSKMDFNPLYIVLIIFGLGGILAFVVLWERNRYKIVADTIKEKDESEIAKNTLDDHDYLAELNQCLESGDGSAFLKTADKALEQIRRKHSGTVPESIEQSIVKIKDEIYGYKFGRGTISAKHMKHLHDEIVGLAG